VGIDSASAYDPYGDKVENGNLAALAVDADRATAWQTVVYRGNNLAGKPGVGLVLDLGKAVDVTAVKVRFLASGQDATIYVTDSATPDIATATQLGSFTSGDTSVTVTGDKPLSGRYVVIWLTKVPQIPTGSYQGSIAEVTVLS
jgi:hypothetical protein